MVDFGCFFDEDFVFVGVFVDEFLGGGVDYGGCGRGWISESTRSQKKSDEKFYKKVECEQTITLKNKKVTNTICVKQDYDFVFVLKYRDFCIASGRTMIPFLS